MNKISSFPPIINAEATILILGTMPGAMSLAKQEYYAHQQNAFWKIMYSVFASLPVSDAFSDKVALLKQNQIAVWDVLKHCEREGSLDTNIKNYQENDIIELLSQHPKIKTIIFNGQKSEQYFLKKFGILANMRYFQMPSTSPAHTMKFDDKLQAWSAALR